MIVYTTREEWLRAASNIISERLKLKPKSNLRVTCGWPIKGARSGKTLGECYDTAVSADGSVELVVTMRLKDPIEVLAVLVHELIHAKLPFEAGHKALFKEEMDRVGLVGKATATKAGEKLTTDLALWASELGDYPHATLDLSKVKKQTTRMVKIECVDCGYTLRTTRKWIEVGVPSCPGCNLVEQPMTVDGQTDGGGEDDDGKEDT